MKQQPLLTSKQATFALHPSLHDVAIDRLIQTTLRSEFKDCTIITIAHRIDTVMDYDRIVVLEKGEIKECDSPDVLLKQENSLFSGLASQAGIV